MYTSYIFIKICQTISHYNNFSFYINLIGYTELFILSKHSYYSSDIKLFIFYRFPTAFIVLFPSFLPGIWLLYLNFLFTCIVNNFM